MKKVTIAGSNYKVNPRLDNFSINQKPSSNIDFFGSNPQSNSVFVQFRNGGTYIYSGVTSDAAIELINAESIGRAVNQVLVGKFPSEKLEGVGLVKEVA